MARMGGVRLGGVVIKMARCVRYGRCGLDFGLPMCKDVLGEVRQKGTNMTEEKLELEDQKLYFKKSLLLFLKQQGLPHSKPTLLKYEKLGLIPSPRRNIEGFSKNWRRL